MATVFGTEMSKCFQHLLSMIINATLYIRLSALRQSWVQTVVHVKRYRPLVLRLGNVNSGVKRATSKGRGYEVFVVRKT